MSGGGGPDSVLGQLGIAYHQREQGVYVSYPYKVKRAMPILFPHQLGLTILWTKTRGMVNLKKADHILAEWRELILKRYHDTGLADCLPHAYCQD